MSKLHLCLLLSVCFNFSSANKHDTPSPVSAIHKSIAISLFFSFIFAIRLNCFHHWSALVSHSAHFIFYLTDDVVLEFRSNESTDERIVNLEANSFVRVRLINVPKSVAFAVVQAHSQVHRISLSQSRQLEIGSHVNGTSIGLLVELDSTNTAAVSYVVNTQPFNITVLVFALYYDHSGKLSDEYVPSQAWTV